MGLCENMMDPRWTGSSEGFRGRMEVMLLLLLLLLLGLSSSQTAPQTSCSAADPQQNLTQIHYQDSLLKDSGVGCIKAFVQSFLFTVQPKPFPKDLILHIIKNYENMVSKEEITKVLLYEVGFLVCLVIGVLYIILMPIVGFFLVCCRCFGNCGGKMYQKQTSSTHSRRRTLYWSAFVTTVIILAGNIIMFKSNEAFKVNVDQSLVELSRTIQNTNKFFTTVPQQIDFVVNESDETVQEVTKNLNAIGPKLGTEIQKQLKVPLDPALEYVRLLDQEIEGVSQQLDKLDTALAEVQSSTGSLQTRMTAVKNDLSLILDKPECLGCDNLKPDLDKLTVETSITTISLDGLKSTVDDATKIGLQSSIDDVEKYLDDIPRNVTQKTKAVVKSSTEVLDSITEKISKVASEIPLLAFITNALKFLNQAQKEINSVLPQIERAEHIRFGVCVVICCVVLLVVICNFLGLVLGPLGLTPKEDPSKRSCTADCGGTFLMMSAGLSFLFSWLFMIAVVILFLLGGNVYTLVCRPWSNGELLKFIDTPDLIPGLEIGSNFGLKTNIKISDIYRDCEKNQPLWTTFHLFELTDLEDLLDVSKYTEEIEKNFENIDIAVPTIRLLSADVQKQLKDIQAENVDSTAITQDINTISTINLNLTAEKVDLLSDTQTGDIQTELKNEARTMRAIQANIETTIIPQLENLNSTIKSLKSMVENIKGTAGKVLSNMGAAQDFLDQNTAQIIKTELKKFLNCQLDYFIVYTDWAKRTITQQVGRCEPIAGAVDSAEIILCAYMVESLNAFWFSLAWCIIFFIPSIIFSVKLAKYYRRMKYTDALDNNIIMNHIPRAQMKSF